MRSIAEELLRDAFARDCIEIDLSKPLAARTSGGAGGDSFSFKSLYRRYHYIFIGIFTHLSLTLLKIRI